MSTYPDWQGLQQWNGTPLAQDSGNAIGGGAVTSGVLQAGSWASVLVWVKATAQPITVTAKQTIAGGPAGLSLSESWVVAAGTTKIVAVVLDADQVEVSFLGGGAGCILDYAVVPSNTSTSTAAIDSAGVDEITGLFDGAGAIQGGTGFNVVRNALGNYTVTYTVAFPAPPVTLCSLVDAAFNARFPLIYARSAAAFSVVAMNSAGALADETIMFLSKLTI